MGMAVMTVDEVSLEIQKVRDCFASSFAGIDGFSVLLQNLSENGCADMISDVITALSRQLRTEMTEVFDQLEERLADRETSQLLAEELERRAALQGKEAEEEEE